MSFGCTLITDPMHTKKPQGNDIGHCFIAIDPGLFRDRQEVTAEAAPFCNDLRATRPADPAEPVVVAASHNRLTGAAHAARDSSRSGPAEPGGVADRSRLRGTRVAG